MNANSLKKNLVTSSGFHVGLIGILFALGIVQKTLLDKIKKDNIILIESSVRVDVVAMPRMTLKELEAAQVQDSAAATKSKAPEVKEETPDTKNTFMKKGKSFADLMKNLSKKDVGAKKGKTKVKNRPKGKGDSLSDSARADLKSLVLAGNKISEGTAVSGSGSSARSEGFVRYVQNIPVHVRPQWTLPSYLMDKDLKCRIRIYIGNDGRLLKAEIFESSGNDEYDGRALRAVKISAPFPTPESKIAKSLSRGDLVLGFPL